MNRSLTFALVGLIAASAGAAHAAHAQDAPSASPASASGGLLYVCVQDEASVAVLDVTTHEVVRTIDLTTLGFSANAKPHHIAVEPDGSHWYVSLIGDGRIVRLDREDRVVGQYATETPGMLALDADRDVLFASRSMSAVNPPARVSQIEVESMEGEDVEVLFPRPHPMVVTSDGRWAYTGSLGENQLAAVDVEAGEATLTAIEGSPHALVQFALSPDGGTLVAATEVTGQLLVFDLADPARPALVASVEVGPMAFDPAFSADGRTVWVPSKGANHVTIVDTGTWEVTDRIESPAFRQPHAVLFSPDGRWAFVSNNAKADHMADPAHAGHAMADESEGGPATGSVTVIDAATREVVKVIELGANVTGMGLGGAAIG